MQPEPPFVSIVIPVRNEERILGRCLESIARLEYPRHRFEVIVADSLSTDNSRLIAQEFGALVVPNQGQTVVSGRNCGFAASRGEFVAFTDADCIVRGDWLKTGVNALGPEEIAGVGGVTLFPEDATAFQKAVNVLFLMAGFAGATCHRQSIGAAHTVTDIPGCNAIYRRSALEMVMPLDEHLLTAEDVWLNWSLRSRGFQHVVSENMVLWHHRRSRPRSFFRQMYRFAIGRLQVGKRNRRLLRPLHVLAGAALPLFAAALGAAFLWGGVTILAALALAAGAAAAIAGVAKTGSVGAGLWVPFVLAVFLLAWSLGFLREWLFPLREVNGK